MDSKNSKPKTQELEAYSESQRSVALQKRVLREKLKMDQAVSLLLFGTRGHLPNTPARLGPLSLLPRGDTRRERRGARKVFSPTKFSRGIQ